MPATFSFRPSVLADSGGSVPDVQPVKMRAAPPTMASLGQIHSETHTPPQGPEADIEETVDGVHVERLPALRE
jgi:hypothetical protein